MRKVLSSSSSSSDKDSDKDSALDSVLAAALATIPDSVASAGISSFPTLSSQFHHAVAPQLRKVALVPEQGGGVLSYLTSVVLSNLMFEKEGWSEGNDVISTVARAKFWLENKDLDLAAREVNSLKGESGKRLSFDETLSQ